MSDSRVSAGILLAATGLAGDDLHPFAQANFPFMRPSFAELTTPTLVVAGDHDQSKMSSRGPDWFTDAYTHSPGATDLLTFFGAEHGLGGIDRLIERIDFIIRAAHFQKANEHYEYANAVRTADYFRTKAFWAEFVKGDGSTSVVWRNPYYGQQVITLSRSDVEVFLGSLRQSPRPARAWGCLVASSDHASLRHPHGDSSSSVPNRSDSLTAMSGNRSVVARSGVATLEQDDRSTRSGWCPRS